MEIRTLAEGLGFPEGPVALADGSVLLVEIFAGTLTRVRPDGTKTVVARPRGGPNGAALGPDGKCYICNNGGFRWHIEGSHRRPLMQADDYSGGRIERIDLETGTVETLYRTAGEVPLKGPNDLVFDAQGGFYFSDLGKVRAREMDRGAVYYAKADGSFITEVAFPMITPNGVGLSPDEKTLYVAETESARLWACGPSTSSSRGSLKSIPGPRHMAAVSSPGSADFSASIHWRSTPTGASAWPPSSTAGLL